MDKILFQSFFPFSLSETLIKKTLYHGMIGVADALSLIVDSEIETLKVIPSRVELIGFEVEMMSSPGRELALKNLLAGIKNNFEYLLVSQKHYM